MIKSGVLDLKDFKAFTFPGGERHVTISPQAFEVDWSTQGIMPSALYARIYNSDDLMDLLLATDVLESLKIKPRRLIIPYLPYARQDRRTHVGSPFSLKIFANLINALRYEQVCIFEPHSLVAENLIQNCKVLAFDWVAELFISDPKFNRDPSKSVLLSPDAGAIGRTSRLQGRLNYPMGVAIKKRDPETGRLEIRDLLGNFSGADVFVLDDICDGGATFIQLAEYIKEEMRIHCIRDDATKLHLFVAHGIFSKGLDELFKYYETIGTTDSFFNEERTPVPEYAKDRFKVYTSIGEVL